MSHSVVSGQSRVTASELLKEYTKKAHKEHDAITEEELYITRLFASRSAHLPGNNWCQDWMQWMMNNHPLLALCFRHRLNPVGLWPRLVILLSSISFGMIATNLVYLFYRSYPDANGSVVKIVIAEDNQGYTETVQITYEAIVVWTLGGLLHSLVDLGLWHLNACACCIQSRVAKLGPLLSIAIAAVLAACSTFAVLWRATYEDDAIENSSANDIGEEEGVNDWVEIQNLSSFQFLGTYYIELLSVWYVDVDAYGYICMFNACITYVYNT